MKALIWMIEIACFLALPAYAQGGSALEARPCLASAIEPINLPANMVSLLGKGWVLTKTVDIPPAAVKSFCFFYVSGTQRTELRLVGQDFRKGWAVFQSANSSVPLAGPWLEAPVAASILSYSTGRHFLRADDPISEVRVVNTDPDMSWTARPFVFEGRLNGIFVDEVVVLPPGSSPRALRERDLSVEARALPKNHLILRADGLEKWLTDFLSSKSPLEFFGSLRLQNGLIEDTWKFRDQTYDEICVTTNFENYSSAFPIGGLSETGVREKKSSPEPIATRRWPAPGTFPPPEKKAKLKFDFDPLLVPRANTEKGGIEPTGIGGVKALFSNCALFQGSRQIQLAYRKNQNQYEVRSIYNVQDLIKIIEDPKWSLLSEFPFSADAPANSFSARGERARHATVEFYQKFPEQQSSLRKAFLLSSLMMGPAETRPARSDVEQLVRELEGSLTFELDRSDVRGSWEDSAYGQAAKKVIESFKTLASQWGELR